jgi:hypothetical protein
MTAETGSGRQATPMNRSSEESRPHLPSVPDRTVFWIGVASLLAASLSYAFAWDGGLWAVPISLALAVAKWWSAWRRGASGWVRAGVMIASVAVLTGGYAFASSGGVQPALRTHSSSYLPGDVVGVRLKAGIRFVGYNLCFGFATLERLDGDGWDTVDVNLGPHDGEVYFCTLELRSLPSLLGAKETVHLPPDLPSGEYRLSYELEVGGELRKVATGHFTVRG